MSGRRGAVLGVLAVVTVAGLLRWPIADVPLERDEGEYAYIAQRWLAGAVPYRDAFDQKPPGVFAAYAAAIAAMGPSVAAIHWGTQVYTLATLGVIYLAGRSLFGPRAGLAAALVAAFLTTDRCVLGNAANTETFMILPMTAGFLAAVRAARTGSAAWAAAAGACGTLALLCKQVALPNVAFHGLILLGHPRRFRLAAAYVAAGAVSVVPVVAYFMSAGAVREFVDCVVGHNIDYVQTVAWYHYPFFFTRTFLPIAVAWLPVLILTLVGSRTATVEGQASLRLAGWWLLASCAGVAIGGYFRPHYYIQAIPPLAVLAGHGAAVLAGRWAPGRAGTITALVAGGAVAFGVLASPWYYLTGTPAEKSRGLYGDEPFPEAAVAAEFIARGSGPGDSIFVYGSEPEIYFYADRRSASRYIFVYPLLTPTPDVLDRQRGVLDELAAHSPRYVVVVHRRTSFYTDARTPHLLPDELTKLLVRDYRLAGVIGPGEAAMREPGDATAAPSVDAAVPHSLAVWERRSPGDG